MFGKLRNRLGKYGIRMMASGRCFLKAAEEALSTIRAAFVGRIILPPLQIFARGISALVRRTGKSITPVKRLAIRTLIDVPHAVRQRVYGAVIGFDKRVLFPVIERIREDDAAALVAFVVMLAILAVVIYLLSNLLQSGGMP